MKKIIPILFSLSLFFLLPLNTFASTLDDIKWIIKNEYVGEINGDLERAATINEVIDMLDPYSAYFSAEEYEAFINGVDLSTVGIGVIIEKHEKGILIVDVIETGSAKKSGIVPGDIIIKVNGQSTVNMTVEEAQALLLGKKNTNVGIEILKEDGSIVSKLISRQSFSLPNVTSNLLYGNVGYISLNSFSEDGARLVANAYQGLLNKGATSFILDLQYNGGGYVSTAEELIGMFPGAKNAYKLRLPTETILVQSVQQALQFPVGTRILVNRYSASASEMTAVALLDQKAAILYGEQTYGKGTMQGFYELEDGSYLKLTIGEFYGPRGTVVKKVGVTPNIKTTSNPIFQAHFDSIIRNLKNYKSINSLTNVPTTKTFKVTFNKEINEKINPNSVELVALGGNKVDINLEVSGNQMTVKPINPLISGGQYILIFHPSIKDVEGKQLNSGRYLHITVAENL